MPRYRREVHRCLAREFRVRMPGQVRQKDVADAIGMEQAEYSKMERGKRQLFTSDLIKLTEYFGCTADQLLGLSETVATIFANFADHMLTMDSRTFPRSCQKLKKRCNNSTLVGCGGTISTISYTSICFPHNTALSSCEGTPRRTSAACTMIGGITCGKSDGRWRSGRSG